MDQADNTAIDTNEDFRGKKCTDQEKGINYLQLRKILSVPDVTSPRIRDGTHPNNER